MSQNTEIGGAFTINASVYEIILRLKVSKHWKDVFYRIHTSYLNNYFHGQANNEHFWMYAPIVAVLPIRQKLNFNTSLNLWGFLFGPFYYIAKLMYKKAIILTVLLYFLATFNQITPYYIPLIFLYCGIFANRDYFIKKILNNPLIKAKPEMLNDYVDEDYFAEVAGRKNYYIILAICVIAAAMPIAAKFFESYILTQEARVAIAEVPKVCSEEQDCKEFIDANLYKISVSQHPEKEYHKNYKVACAYAIIGDRVNATRFLDLAIAQNPDYLAAWLTRATYQYKNKNYQEALYNYGEALRIAPRAKFLNYYIGEAYYRMNDYQNALKYLDLAVESDKNNPKYLEIRGYTNIYINNVADGIKDLEKAARLFRQDKEKNEVKIKNIENYVRKLKRRLNLEI